MIVECEKLNSSFCKVICEEYDIILDINAWFSVFTDGYQFSPSYKMHLWDGKTKFFNLKNQILPIGLKGSLKKFCEKNGYEYKESGFENYEEFNSDEFKSLTDKFVTKLTMREYQAQATKIALNKRMGILECCTSSGKSLMIYDFIRIILSKGIKKVLLIVPNVSLVEQMYSDFKNYGWNDINDYVELLYAGKIPTYKTPVLITTWQSLKDKSLDFFEEIDAVICDECHNSKANVINKILKACVNTKYRIGTTGTLPTSNCDLMYITGVLGNSIFKITSKELIDKGFLTKMTIANIFLKYPFDFIKVNHGRNYPEEVKIVEEYKNRLKSLDIIFSHTPADHNVLLLVNHIEHLKETAEYIMNKFTDRKVKVMSGSVKAAEREFIRLSVENETGLVIVATYGVASTGINMPKLHDVILFANSKSKIRVLQSLGRGLRKHEGKNKVILYDIIDDLSYITKKGKTIYNYLYKHWIDRNKYYKEQEFPQISTEVSI